MQQANWYVWASCSAWLTVVTPLGYCCCSSVAQSCPTPCDTRDCSPPGSSVHAILQARILEWVAIPSSRGPSQPRDWARVSCVGRQILYHWAPWEVLLFWDTCYIPKAICLPIYICWKLQCPSQRLSSPSFSWTYTPLFKASINTIALPLLWHCSHSPDHCSHLVICLLPNIR